MSARVDSTAYNPVLLLVDDNADDLGALTGALAVRYAAEYDIRMAATAGEAEAELASLAKAGAEVGLVIVSLDLQGCDPIALLNHAKQLHPRSKRVLTARYLDPVAFGVIVASMRGGRIDYFLNKPWEPRIERLYPIIDDLLVALRATKRDSAFQVIRIIGKQWDPRSHKMRDILERSTIPYGFYDSDSEDGKRILAENGLDGSRLPVVAFYFGVVLVEPTMEQIALALGARTNPEPGLYDVTIVGAGPAGLAAAVYAASEGLRTLVVDREIYGGQAGASSNIDNYLGFPRGVSGKELARRAFEQAWRFGADMVFTKAVTGIRTENETRVVTLSDGVEVPSRTVVIATGVTYRQLDVPGIDKFVGAGVFYGSPMCEAPSFSGENALIVGAGNSAGQAAVHLSRFASRVIMVVRERSLSTSMSDYLIRQIEAHPNIEVRCGNRIVEGHGDKRLNAVTVQGPKGNRETLSTKGLFVLVGGVPHTQWLAGSVKLDEHGYVLTGRDLVNSENGKSGWPLEREPYFLETSMPGVFAAGDVRCRAVKRVASAVGEGATAIQLVHDYLRAE